MDRTIQRMETLETVGDQKEFMCNQLNIQNCTYAVCSGVQWLETVGLMLSPGSRYKAIHYTKILMNAVNERHMMIKTLDMHSHDDRKKFKAISNQTYEI